MTITISELLETAMTSIDKMLSDYSCTSIASTAEVNDGLLDLRLTISQIQRMQDQEIDSSLDELFNAMPTTV